VRWIFPFAVVGTVGLVAFRNYEQLLAAIRLMGRVSPWLMLAAVAAIGGTFFSRGSAYRIALQAMGYTFGRPFLARTALVATSAHHLLPTGGASGYAAIMYTFHRRGVAAGQASILALVDTLSNAAALGSLVIVVLVRFAAEASLGASGLGVELLPGIGLLALAALLYYLQRDRERLWHFVRRCKDLVSRLVKGGWREEPIERFFDQYYEGKRLIVRKPQRFLRMVGWQYAAVACNCIALYSIFFALGSLPSPWILFAGLVLALAGVSIIAVPAGGGGFEVVMSSYFAMHGIATADSIAAALLYRLVSFWLPAIASIVVLARLRRHRRGALKE
jgi:uncharacterized protein (TIRG00374 family)